MSERVPFAIGTHVAYTSGAYEDEESNPLWGGAHGYVVGVISDVMTPARYCYGVTWDNNSTNNYRHDDLQKVYQGLIGDWILIEDAEELPVARVAQTNFRDFIRSKTVDKKD